MKHKWWLMSFAIFSSATFAGPNNYIGIDADGKVYEINYGASSGSVDIDEMGHYSTYSGNIIYFDIWIFNF